MRVEQMFIHQHYNNASFTYDVAIWKVTLPLQKYVAVMSYLPNIRLAKNYETIEGKQLIIAGWGKSRKFAFFQPKILLEATVPITSDRYCIRAYPELRMESCSFCAGYEQGKIDTCQGLMIID
jgi:trypsin